MNDIRCEYRLDCNNYKNKCNKCRRNKARHEVFLADYYVEDSYDCICSEDDGYIVCDLVCDLSDDCNGYDCDCSCDCGGDY